MNERQYRDCGHDRPFPAIGRRMRRRCYAPLLAALLLLAGCEKDVPGNGPDDGCVALSLEAAIDEGPASKAPLTGTAFPVSGGAGSVSNIGLYLMKSDGTTPYATGSDNLLAELTGQTGPVYSWRYQYAGGSSWANFLKVSSGTTVKLWGYYPRLASGVSATAVPFDLTTAAQRADQTDLLWSPLQTVAVSASAQSVALNFRHAYALLEFLVKTSSNVSASVTAIEVMNKSGKSWMANKGNLNAQTGAFSGTTAGTVGITCNGALATDSYTIFRVMVPAFSGAYADGDIEVQFYIGGVALAGKFLIKQSYLSGSSGSYGLTAGLKYAYKLLYEATAGGSVSVLPWSAGGANDDHVGGGETSDGSVSITTDWSTSSTSGSIGHETSDGTTSTPSWGTSGANGDVGDSSK